MITQPVLYSLRRELTKIADSKGPLYRRVKRESPVEVRETEEAREFGGGYFDPRGDGHIGVSHANFETLAHEVGHAQNHQTIWGKIIQSVPANLAYALSPIAGAFAGHALANGEKWPLIMPVAAVTPVLLSEMLATSKGHEVLKKVGAKPEEVEKYRDNLRSAFSTYLQVPALAAATGAFWYLLQKATAA